MTRGIGKGRTSLMPTEVGEPHFPSARGGAGSDCAQDTPHTVQTIARFGRLRQAPRGLQTFLRTTLDTTQEAPLAIVDGNSSTDDPRMARQARQQRPQERHASPRAMAHMALITTRTADSRAQP